MFIFKKIKKLKEHAAEMNQLADEAVDKVIELTDERDRLAQENHLLKTALARMIGLVKDVDKILSGEGELMQLPEEE